MAVKVSHGGRREGAGRPRGPEKVWLKVGVLPATRDYLMRLALRAKSLGEVLDKKFAKAIVDKARAT